MSKFTVALLGLLVSFSANANSIIITEEVQKLVPAFVNQLELTSTNNACQLTIKADAKDFTLSLKAGAYPLVFKANNNFAKESVFDPADANEQDDGLPMSEEGYFYYQNFHVGQSQLTLILEETYYFPNYPKDESIESTLSKREVVLEKENQTLKVKFNSFNSEEPKLLNCVFAL